MASEAQRLIGISLTKIAQSRSHRGGVSLHKNLLVATVLQKARYIFMEEAYNMVHFQQQQQQQQQQPPMVVPQQPVPPPRIPQPTNDDLIGLTVEEAAEPMSTLPEEESSSSSSVQDYLQPGCLRCHAAATQDKENQPPYGGGGGTELTYLDLDKSSPCVLKDQKSANSSSSCSLKRRRAVTEWETEEAVQSILPKRRCSSASLLEGDDSVFLDDATLLSDAVSKELEQKESTCTAVAGNSMEIDRITSLVSIFSFGMGDAINGNKQLARSMSTPDLCSSQAKESAGSGDAIQRPFLAMTV